MRGPSKDTDDVYFVILGLVKHKAAHFVKIDQAVHL